MTRAAFYGKTFSQSMPSGDRHARARAQVLTHVPEWCGIPLALASVLHGIVLITVLRYDGPGMYTMTEVQPGIAMIRDEVGHLYIANRSDTGTVLSPMTELFGIGAGSWALGKDAQDHPMCARFVLVADCCVSLCIRMGSP